MPGNNLTYIQTKNENQWSLDAKNFVFSDGNLEIDGQ